MARLFKGRVSIGLRAQSDLTTPASTGSSTDWAWPQMEQDYSVDFATEVEERMALRAISAGAYAGAFGSRFGTKVTLKGWMQGFESTYDPTSDTPPITPQVLLASAALGVSLATSYQAAAITSGSTTSTIELASGTTDIGVLAPYGSGPTSIVGMGWTDGQSGTTVSLVSAAAAAAASGNHIYPARVVHSSFTQFQHLTLRLCGDNAAWDMRFWGGTVESLKITPATKRLARWEATIVFCGWYFDSSGGLVTPTVYNDIPTLHGVNGARMLRDGSAVCGLTGWEVAIENVLSDLDCMGEDEGVTEVHIAERNVTGKYEEPIDSSDISSQALAIEAGARANTAQTLEMQVGVACGQIFSMLIPKAVQTATPKWKDVGGNGKIVGREVMWKAVEPTAEAAGDGDSTTAINQAVKLAWA